MDRSASEKSLKIVSKIFQKSRIRELANSFYGKKGFCKRVL